MSGDDHEHLFMSEPQPERPLDLYTIQENRRRVLGAMFAREVEIRQLEDPSYAIAEPESDTELLAAIRELEDIRQAHKKERLRRDGEFKTFWKVIDILDEMENDAIKQLDVGEGA